MAEFIVKTTSNKQIIDLTDKVNQLLDEQEKNQGLCFVFVKHTTCCLTTADLDPGTDQDYLQAIDKIFPQADYKHPHNPEHVGDHIMSSIIGSGVWLPFESKSLQLGTWQKIVLIELNGPRNRQIELKFLKTSS